MKRGYFIIIALVACILSSHAQSGMDFVLNKEGKVTAIPKYKQFEFNIPEFSYKTYTPSTTPSLEKRLRDFIPDLPQYMDDRSGDERPMDMQVLSEAYRPFFNVYAPMIRRVSPMAFDFREDVITPISNNAAVITTGSQYSWPGLGGLTRISSSVIWQQDRWTLTGGAFAGRYFTPFNYSPDFMGGVNVSVGYEATDWLTLRGWGQYALYEKGERKNPHMLLNPYYNHTNVGGAFEINISDGVGIGVGINYEYNPWKRGMDRQILFYPAIKNKNIKIGFN